MTFLRHSLHPPLGRSPPEERLLRDALARLGPAARARASARWRDVAPAAALVAAADTVSIPLTTVSLRSAFDSTIIVRLRGSAQPDIDLLVDSGNSMLILPSWQDIAAAPAAADYAVLGDSVEPWGCPAKVVRGPIEIPTVDGGAFEIVDCTFYACTGPSPDTGATTSNFGVGCLSPWTSSRWNQPDGIGAVLRAPLADAAGMGFATFEYAPADDVLAIDAQTPQVHAGSLLTLSASEPAGFVWLGIVPGLPWMSLRPRALSIDGTRTAWPGDTGAIAMVDTGGTCVFLSDPQDLVCRATWPPVAANPDWTAQSTACESTAGTLGLELGDPDGNVYGYTVDPAKLPAAAQGLTLVMCHENSFMWGQDGLNTGGLSALFNAIAIDYAGQRVGFRPR